MTTPPNSDGFVRRLGLGVLWGWSIATPISLIPLIRYAALSAADKAALSGNDDILSLAILAYFTTGFFAGLLGGLLGRFVKGWVRRSMLGFLAGVIALSGAVVTDEGGFHPSQSTVLLWFGLAALIGPAIAWLTTKVLGDGRWPFPDTWP